MIEMVQKNWTYGKIKQVIGEEPTSEFDNKAFFKYGCKVVQGTLTESQQQMELGQLLHLKEIFPDLVQPEDILPSMNIQNKNEFLARLKERQKALQQQQQEAHELQMRQIQVDNATKLSYAHSQEGLAKEREAKIQTDIAVAQDKLKRAEEESTHSLLNLVKTLKELQGMDLSRIQQQIDAASQIQSMHHANLELQLAMNQNNQPNNQEVQNG